MPQKAVIFVKFSFHMVEFRFEQESICIEILSEILVFQFFGGQIWRKMQHILWNLPVSFLENFQPKLFLYQIGPKLRRNNEKVDSHSIPGE